MIDPVVLPPIGVGSKDLGDSLDSPSRTAIGVLMVGGRWQKVYPEGLLHFRKEVRHELRSPIGYDFLWLSKARVYLKQECVADISAGVFVVHRNQACGAGEPVNDYHDVAVVVGER